MRRYCKIFNYKESKHCAQIRQRGGEDTLISLHRTERGALSTKSVLEHISNKSSGLQNDDFAGD